MKRLWLITNPGSGSASDAKCEAIVAILGERGLDLAGRTLFPDEGLPDADFLRAQNVDTVVLFAGDGTINAAVCTLADWDGRFLILPGGTMNLLAKALHGDRPPAEIIHDAHEAGAVIALPFVEAGPHRAFVGVIVGPAAHWAKAREAVRKRRLNRLLAAARFAWTRTFGRGIRVGGVPSLSGRYQAVFISPADAQRVDAAAIDARDWRAIAGLGWDWLTGEWVQSRAVTACKTSQLTIRGDRTVLALFDGEVVHLDAGTRVTGGVTSPVFVSTRNDRK